MPPRRKRKVFLKPSAKAITKDKNNIMILIALQPSIIRTLYSLLIVKSIPDSDSGILRTVSNLMAFNSELLCLATKLVK